LLAVDQHTERLVHGALALVRRQVQDGQILPIGPRRLRFLQQVVGSAETARREQLVAIAIMCQGAGLADQRVDHVPVIDPLLLSPTQPRQRLDPLLPVPHFQVLQVNPHFDPRADQPAVHRVGVAVKVNQAAGVDAAAHLQATTQPLIRQVA